MDELSATFTELLADPVRARSAERLLPPEGRRSALDRLTSLAAQLLGAPSAQVSLLATEQTVVAGAGEAFDHVGVRGDLKDTLCSVTAASRAPLVVGATAVDDRVRMLPPVTSGLVGSYLGVPLINDEGSCVGALCVWGPEPQEWVDGDVATLTQLATAVMAELELAALTTDFDRERRRWELALDAAEVGSFDWDLRSGALHWDRRLRVVLGFDPDQDETTHIDTLIEFIDPQDRAQVDDAIAAAVASCGNYRTDYRIQLASGETRWIAARGRVFAGPEGKPQRMLGTAQDITELRTARDEAARLADSMLTGFVSVDREWHVTYLNPAGSAVVGYTPRQLVGLNFWDAFPEMAELEFGRQYERAVATGEVVDFEAYYPRLHAWFDVRAVPGQDGLVIYFSDITERHADQEAAAEAARNLRLLARAAEALVEPDIDRAIAGLARALVPELACWTLVSVRDEAGRFLEQARAHADAALQPVLDAYVDAGLAALTEDAALSIVTRSGEPLLVEDYMNTKLPTSLSSESRRDQLRALEPDRVLTVPISGRTTTMGAITLVRRPGRAPWSVAETATAMEIGRRAGGALQNAQLVRQQRQLSETLQNSLLSTPPRSPDAEIAVRYQPAALDAAVGGDWYDSFLLRDGATKLVVGDVSGHDREAAAAMGQVRALLRGTAYATSGSCGEVLTALDEAMEGLEIDTLATCVLGKITANDAGARVFEWSNAGHPPPVLVAPGQAPTLLAREPELLLGLDPTAARSAHAVDLPDDSLVLLYTDGLVERRDEGLDAGLDRLLHVLEGLEGLPLDELCDKLLLTMAPDPQDDVVLLAARVLRRG
ncbi:SpoIIE family protein phosphatase [Nocardioides sp.]|uniref:SpoIIE family protein phosphatase n=1 Tax=Nocardioides sp. TaxID=35761 RepID=UPI002BDBB8CC|nr:SpoIIE family protein phosphatase [Nocardioides sp.]HXH78847.1 SpoIIE family protein phosphatase [Nocardioides sp.]